MQLDKNNVKYYGESHKVKHKFHKKTLIFLAFLFVMSMIIITTLYNNGSITGNIVSPVNPNNSLIISSELTCPHLSFNVEGSEIKILSDSETTIYLGDKSLLLNSSRENRIILRDFSGKVQLSEEGVLLDGKVSDISLNYLPIKEKNDKKIKIYSDSPIPYNLLEFKGSLFLKEINYISSGILFIGERKQDKITLNEDSLIISDYFGTLKIKKDTLFLEGSITKIRIDGDMKTITISN